MKTLLPNPDSTTSFSMKSAKVRLPGWGRLRTFACFFLLASTMDMRSALAQQTQPVSQPVILADFNHDGIPDALVQSTVTPTATIAFGSVPYGTFGGNVKAVTFPAACTSLPVGSIAVGDFNGDGFQDIAYFCGTRAGTMLGKGDGTFGVPVTLPGVATSSGILGDFNKDGKTDIAVLSNEGNGQAIRFLSGKGDGTFNEPLLSNLAVSTYTTLVAADLNADGYPDLVLINSAPDVADSLEVLGNNKNGTFGAGNQGIYSANTVASLSFGGTAPILVGSFFGTATIDVAVVDTGVNGQLFAFKNTSTATAYSFSDPVTIPVANLKGAQAGKFTGRGYTDIAVANGTSIAVLANYGSANFAASYPTLTLASTNSRFAVADANNDSYADIYTASLPVTGALQLGVNLTTGSATATSQSFSLGVGNRAISAAWSGNVNFTGSNATGNQVVIGVASTTTLTSSKNPSLVGDPVSFSVHAAPTATSNQTPTGRVVLTDGTAILASGTLDGAGNFYYSTSSLTQRTHTIAATYAGDALYLGSSATLAQVVNHAAIVAPTLTWAAPAPIVYGTALSATQLNASVAPVNGLAIPGRLAYTPDIGTILGAGTQNLSVTFIPNDLLSFSSVTRNVSLVVSKATPVITWATPASIAYGTPLSAAQLNAAAGSVPGKLVYTPAAGKVLNAGPQTLSVTFTPTDLVDYLAVTRTVPLVVSKSTPVITWTNPASIAYGTPLSAMQLNAGITGPTVPGALSYTPAAGTVLNAGAQTLSATFKPTDLVNYAAVTTTVQLTVTKSTPVITWANPASIAYGTPLSSAQLNATAAGIGGTALTGKFTYTPAAVTVLAPGTQTLMVSFTPADATDYNIATASVQLVVTGVTVASFTPTTVMLGSGATTITVTGAGFAASTVVQVNATAIPTTLVNPTTLIAVIPASYLKTVGTLTITLSNPGVTTPIPVGSFSVTASQPVPILDVPPTTNPGTQPTVTLSLAEPYPVDIMATVSLTFAASTTPPIDDPAIVFEESGKRTETVAIPAGTITVPPILLQAGTVAGTITVPITLTAGGVNVTPANLAPGIIVVPAAVPTVSSVKVIRSGQRLTVVVHGFSNTREMVNAKFHFTPAAGATLGTADFTLPASAIFNANWFQTTASNEYGSTFTYTQIFDLSDDATIVSAVDVTLANSVGASDMKSAQ